MGEIAIWRSENCPRCSSRVCDHPERPRLTLNDRERSILKGLGQGLTNQQIATDVGLALITVCMYVSRLYAKLGLHTRYDATMWALAHAELL
jgi:DNA-binding NarL/FixJ family response regulator